MSNRIHYISINGLEIDVKKAIDKGDLLTEYTKEYGTRYFYKGIEVKIQKYE